MLPSQQMQDRRCLLRRLFSFFTLSPGLDARRDLGRVILSRRLFMNAVASELREAELRSHGDEWHGYREREGRVCLDALEQGSLLRGVSELVDGFRRGSILLKVGDILRKWEIPSKVAAEVLVAHVIDATVLVDRVGQTNFEGASSEASLAFAEIHGGPR